MAVCVSQIRDLLMPGLWEIRGAYSAMPSVWESVFAEEAEAALPTIGVPAALALGAAAVIIHNPEVSRRGLFSWWTG